MASYGGRSDAFDKLGVTRSTWCPTTHNSRQVRTHARPRRTPPQDQQSVNAAKNRKLLILGLDRFEAKVE